MGIEQEQYQNWEGAPVALSPPEQQWAELQRRLGTKDELTPIVMTFVVGLLTIALVYWIIRYTRAFSASDVPQKLTTRPKGLKQLNDSVWELHKPPHRHQVPKVEVLFFHGAQLSNDKEAFWKTWLSRDETILWPKVWLAEKFPDARILSISYDSSVQKFPGQRDTYQIIENLMHDIIWSSTCKAGQNCPVIFAGHCFGGIIIKDFLIQCHKFSTSRAPETEDVKKTETFLQNCKAIFYYSTPHGGTKLMAGLANRGNVNAPIVSFIEILSFQTARINNDFRILNNSILQLATRTIGATGETKLRKFMKRIQVVQEASVRQDAESVYWVDADHFDVSKAKDNTTCSIFTGLCDLVADHYKHCFSVNTNST